MKTSGVLSENKWCFINPVALLILAAILPFELLCVVQENKKAVEARMERLPHEQQREYGNRVFYLSDYAGELRLSNEIRNTSSNSFFVNTPSGYKSFK